MHSTFSTSRLVRLLGGWAPAEVEASGMDFAERLSLWFNAFDAIRLQAAQQAIRALGAPAAGARPPRSADLAADFQRARGALAAAIAQALVVDEPGFAPYRQRQLELQRQMELVIGPLRDHVRQGLVRVSARLRQLAALDAALEQVLAPREQQLLPTAADLLQRRFKELGAQAQPDDAAAPPPDGWRARFEAEWRQALLAELDLRLEPVAGLIEALKNETNHLQ